MNPANRVIRAIGAKADGKAAVKKLDVFTAWFSKNIAPTAADASDKAVVIVPVLRPDSM